MTTEVQHVTIVGEGDISVRADFIRSGAPRVVLTRRGVGLSEQARGIWVEGQLRNAEVRGFGEALLKLADLIEQNGDSDG